MTYTIGQTEERPWGRWTVLDVGPAYTVKRIDVRPHARLSLQRHRHRDEEWIVVGGIGYATLEGQRRLVAQGDRVRVLRGQAHRLEATADPLVVIEVQLGTCDEDDIERLEDDHGRA